MIKITNKKTHDGNVIFQLQSCVRLRENLRDLQNSTAGPFDVGVGVLTCLGVKDETLTFGITPLSENARLLYMITRSQWQWPVQRCRA